MYFFLNPSKEGEYRIQLRFHARDVVINVGDRTVVLVDFSLNGIELGNAVILLRRNGAPSNTKRDQKAKRADEANNRCGPDLRFPLKAHRTKYPEITAGRPSGSTMVTLVTAWLAASLFRASDAGGVIEPTAVQIVTAIEVALPT